MNKKIYCLALGAVLGGMLVSCTNELNEPNNVPNQPGLLKVIKDPKVIAWSGDQVLKNNSVGTRGVDVNGNLWYQNWDRPTNVTEEEISKVLEAVKEPRPNAVNEITIEWENFWVQQVYKGQTTYTDHYENERGLGSDLMNELNVWNDNVEVWWPDHGFGGYETVNNFNRGDNQTTYTDDENKYVYKGTTLMTGMAANGCDPSKQFAYKNSADGGQFYFDYIVVEVDGEYYVCFDFFADNRDNPTATANKDHYIDRDWIFNDWIVKISPAYHVGETPTPPGPTEPEEGKTCPKCNHPSHDGYCDKCGEEEPCHEPGSGPETQDPCPKCDHPAHEGDCPECSEGTVCKPGDQPGGGQVGEPVHHDNEVEVNLSVDKEEEVEEGINDLVSHLSIHVRAATDVEVFIPVPFEYVVAPDDMAIVMQHEPNHMGHGGDWDEESRTHTFTYTLKDSDLTVSLTVRYEALGIRIWTEGVTQEVIDWCAEKCHGDGITFEVWNYFNGEINKETLKEYLNKATITFLDKEPDYYINAFNKDENGEKFGDDCTVSIVGDQRSDFSDEPHVGNHLNGSPYNKIYENKNAENPDGHVSHEN